MDASLCSLEAASFLRQDPQEPATWRFCQLLARDVVYEMVPKDVRRDWHAAAAAAMEAYSSGEMLATRACGFGLVVGEAANQLGMGDRGNSLSSAV